MYAHKVIEDIKYKLPRFSHDPGLVDGLTEIIPLIQKSIKFNLGHVDNLPDSHTDAYFVTDKSGNFKTPILRVDMRNLRMPYPVCFIEIMLNVDKQMDKNGNIFVEPILNSKCAILLVQQEQNSIQCVFFQVSPTDQRWMTLPMILTIRDLGIDHSKDGLELGYVWFGKDIQHQKHERIKILSLVNAINIITQHSITFLRLMSCKNISAEPIKASEKLNKKRLRNGKLPIFDYYVLNIDPLNKSKHAYHDPSIPLSHNRVHLCRGHFKTFTKEHPLLGRGIGTYWWQPHARGQNKEGIIIKDYKLAGGNHA
jgi:hypothetical protein